MKQVGETEDEGEDEGEGLDEETTNEETTGEHDWDVPASTSASSKKKPIPFARSDKPNSS